MLDLYPANSRQDRPHFRRHRGFTEVYSHDDTIIDEEDFKFRALRRGRALLLLLVVLYCLIPLRKCQASALICPERAQTPSTPTIPCQIVACNICGAAPRGRFQCVIDFASC